MLPARSDVVIVGAGFAGCATAWALARRGVRALVVEREAELGRFASGRGAGLGRQLAEDDDTSVLTVRGAALLREHFAPAWSPTGGVLTFDDAAAADAYAARALRFGVAHDFVSRARVAAWWPELDRLPVAAAIDVPSDGVIDVRALLAAYARDLDIAFATRVERIGEADRGIVVETSAGSVTARVVVDASGAWAGAITSGAAFEAHKRHLFVLEAQAAGAAPFLWHLGADELYVRAGGGGLVTSPCDVEREGACDAQISPDADARLRTRFAAASSSLARAPIACRWACQRTFTPDRRMHLGRDPQRPWLVWAAALGGHGATASAAVGDTVADAVLAALG